MARKTLAADVGGIQTPHFEGFVPETFRFFEELSAHQSREWFQDNKVRYETVVRAPLASLVVDLSRVLAERDIPLRGDPKSSLFRIHRDTRFSSNKNPYKTHAGAVLTRSGAKTEPAILYIHIAPDGCFSAAGFYHPAPDVLAGLRQIIAERPATWRGVVSALEGAGLALGQDNKLTRTPRGFEAVTQADLLEALKLKSLIVRRSLSGEDVSSSALVETLASFAQDSAPLLRL